MKEAIISLSTFCDYRHHVSTEQLGRAGVIYPFQTKKAQARTRMGAPFKELSENYFQLVLTSTITNPTSRKTDSVAPNFKVRRFFSLFGTSFTIYKNISSTDFEEQIGANP